MFVALAFACSLNVALAEKDGGLAVAVRGRPAECRVVVPADGTPCHRNAAAELVGWAEKVSGVRLAIVTDAEPLPEIPSWHRAAGAKPWIFTDEIFVK